LITSAFGNIDLKAADIDTLSSLFKAVGGCPAEAVHAALQDLQLSSQFTRFRGPACGKNILADKMTRDAKLGHI
jgi:hypothetical protein